MQSQLVLKIRRRAAEGIDDILQLEQELAAALGKTALVDGHDFGAKNVHVFVLTDDPTSTFRRSKPALEKLELLDKVTVAHRVVGGELFKVIWPLGPARRFKLG